eukprot:tig00020629_g12340.t1
MATTVGLPITNPYAEATPYVTAPIAPAPTVCKNVERIDARQVNDYDNAYPPKFVQVPDLFGVVNVPAPNVTVESTPQRPIATEPSIIKVIGQEPAVNIRPAEPVAGTFTPPEVQYDYTNALVSYTPEPRLPVSIASQKAFVNIPAVDAPTPQALPPQTIAVPTDPLFVKVPSPIVNANDVPPQERVAAVQTVNVSVPQPVVELPQILTKEVVSPISSVDVTVTPPPVKAMMAPPSAINSAAPAPEVDVTVSPTEVGFSPVQEQTMQVTPQAIIVQPLTQEVYLQVPPGPTVRNVAVGDVKVTVPEYAVNVDNAEPVAVQLQPNVVNVTVPKPNVNVHLPTDPVSIDMPDIPVNINVPQAVVNVSVPKEPLTVQSPQQKVNVLLAPTQWRLEKPVVPLEVKLIVGDAPGLCKEGYAQRVYVPPPVVQDVECPRPVNFPVQTQQPIQGNSVVSYTVGTPADAFISKVGVTQQLDAAAQWMPPAARALDEAAQSVEQEEVDLFMAMAEIAGSLPVAAAAMGEDLDAFAMDCIAAADSSALEEAFEL